MTDSGTADLGLETRRASFLAPRRLLLLVAAALAVVALIAAGRQVGIHLDGFRAWVSDLGVWGPVVFIGGYALAVVGFVPGSILTLAAGTIFGLVAGSLYVLIAATLGACAAFLIARHLARESVERRIQGNPRFGAIDRAVGAEGFKIVALLRLSPVFPFSLLNYALGLTGVRFRDYAVASIGMLPGTVLYVYLGAIAGEAASAATGASGSADVLEWVARAIGLAATIAVTVVVTRIARRALREAALD